MIKNKRGQIASGITWFLAFLIIFFAIMLFIAASGAVSSRKDVKDISSLKLIGEGDREGNFGDFDNALNFINILNTKVEDDKTLRILILESLDSYLDNKELMRLINNDINKIKSYSIPAEIMLDSRDINKEKQLFQKIDNVLEGYCKDYIITIPYAQISDGKELLEPLAPEILLDNYKSEIKIPIAYKNQVIIIKYQESKKC